MRRISVIALSLVGLYTLAGFLLKSDPAKEPTPDWVNTFPSPDGRYRAELLTWAGGGGISPYCVNVLLVVPSSADAGQAGFASKYEVYSGDCDNLFDPSLSSKITWTTGNDLHVSLSINGTAAFPATVKLKKTDTTGAVRVAFDIAD